MACRAPCKCPALIFTAALVLSLVPHASTSGFADVKINSTCPIKYRNAATGRCKVRVAIVLLEIFAFPVLDGSLESAHVVDIASEEALYSRWKKKYPSGHVFSAADTAGCNKGEMPCPVLGYDMNLMGKVFGQFLDWDMELVHYETYPSALYATRSGAVDVGWFAAAVTSSREACSGCPAPDDVLAATSAHVCCLDFSYPYFEGGLAVLSKGKAGGNFVEALFTVRMLNVITLFFSLLIISGHIMWLIESRTEAGSLYFPKPYVKGVFQGIYWSCTTATTVGYGDTGPTTAIGKVFTMTWMFVGIVLSGTVAGLMSAALTVQDLQTLDITRLKQLSGKKVCFIPGYYQGYMDREGGSVRQRKLNTITECIRELSSGKVDAILYDKPNLDRMVSQGRVSGEFAVSGLLSAADYAVVCPEGSELTHRISAGVIALVGDSNFVKELRIKWLGELDPSGSGGSSGEDVNWTYVITASVMSAWLVLAKLATVVSKRCCPPKDLEKARKESVNEESWRTPAFNMMEKVVKDGLVEVRQEMKQRFDAEDLEQNRRSVVVDRVLRRVEENEKKVENLSDLQEQLGEIQRRLDALTNHRTV